MAPSPMADDPLPRMGDATRAAFLSLLSRDELDRSRWHWSLWARNEQLPPPGDWRCWLILAGRAFGKTRAGAEWVRTIARTNPDARIALIGASLGDARAVRSRGATRPGYTAHGTCGFGTTRSERRPTRK